MASSQDATDANRGHLERRAQLSDLYQLIVEHVGEDGDDSPAALSARLTALLARDSFAVPVTDGLRQYLVRILGYTQESDFDALRDIPLIVSLIPDFPRTRLDALVVFLQAVDRFCRAVMAAPTATS
jgi:hypothetical protein